MSRIGKQPIPIPSGVDVQVAGEIVTVKGKLGTLTQQVPAGISVATEANQIKVTRINDEKRTRALHGLVRSLLSNNVKGVVDGYKKELEIHGVSYQASATPKEILLKVGFANTIKIAIPEGVKVELPNPTRVVVTGADKQKVGQFAAEVRATRKPEPYKGKGIRYRGEQIQRKQGKSFVGSD
ncbi:MAG: 50S ribosomal protein L6 [Planctomycetota bacterium]|nr:50S ribosomal protein L6 [Planctomycetota bacterium]